MSEDCKQCGTMMWLLDSEGLCPACNGLGFDEDGEPVYDEDDNFMGLVGVQANGTYKIVKK